MKKKYLNNFIIGAAIFGFAACSLDETPIDQLPEDEAYKSQQLIYLNAVAGLYTEIGADGGSSGLAGTDRGLYDLNVFTADEAILPTRGSDWYDGGLWVNLYQHKWTETNDLVKGSWDYLYRVIGKCNQSIDKMQFYFDQDTNNVYLKEYISEVRAIRAMYYYYLLDNFARVPIVTSSTTEIKDVKQSDRSDVLNFVKTELQEVVPDLKSAKSAATGEFYGRMTKSVGYFLLAKLALNAQVYADNDWEDNNGVPNGSTSFTVDGNDIGAWKASIHYCDLITEEGYTLNSSYSANFSVKNEGSPENIFVIPMDPSLYKARNMYCVRTRHYAHGKAWNGQDGWNGASATTDLLTVFRENSVDPRLEMCFFTGKVKGQDGSDVMDGDVVLEYQPDAIKINTTNDATEKTAGARWAKYEFDPNALSGGQLVNNDYVLYRYSDVLLMKSEALVRDGQNGDAPLKLVRARVGATDRSATLDNILKERMLELSWEGFRRQDLIRFGQYNKAVMDREPSAPYRKVFPIPFAVLENNKNLTQNPKY
jgi:hypothetical protein